MARVKGNAGPPASPEDAEVVVDVLQSHEAAAAPRDAAPNAVSEQEQEQQQPDDNVSAVTSATEHQAVARRQAATAVGAGSSPALGPFRESYRDMDELRRALKVLSVQLNAPYYMQHSSPQRVEARCPTWRERKAAKSSSGGDGSGGGAKKAPPVCDFVVSANRHANGRVYVTRSVVEHSPGCPVMAARQGENSVSAAALLETARPIMDALLTNNTDAAEHAKLLEDLGIDAATLLAQGEAAVRPKDMAKLMKDKFGVSASYMAAWRALSALRQQRKDEDSLSFQRINGYLQTFAAANPGSITAFEHVPGTTTFARAFLSPSALAPGALRYCRATLLLSVLLVTSAFGGVVLTVTAQDAMGDHVPLAIGLAPSESEREWHWFLEQLRRAFPELERAVSTLVHNRGEDLARTVADVFPHCMQTDKVDSFMKSAVVGAAGATNAGSSTLGMIGVGGMMPGASLLDPSLVSPGEGGIASGGVNTGAAASTSPSSPMQWMETLCGKAPLMILVGWVSKVASTLFQRYEKYAHVSSEYPAAFHALASQYESAAAHYDVLRVAESGFEVVDKRSGRQRVVDFAKQTCSCGDYDATKFPCLHVFLAVSYAGMLRADVIPRIFLMTSLKTLYGGRVTPIDVDNVPADGVTAPIPAPKTRGRPRKIQQIQQFGDPKQEKLSCSVCGVKGHNKRTCKRVTVAEPARDVSSSVSIAGVADMGATLVSNVPGSSTAATASSSAPAATTSSTLEEAGSAGLIEAVDDQDDDDGAGFLNGACKCPPPVIVMLAQLAWKLTGIMLPASL